jgi:hypothetical protein
MPKEAGRHGDRRPGRPAHHLLLVYETMVVLPADITMDRLLPSVVDAAAGLDMSDAVRTYREDQLRPENGVWVSLHCCQQVLLPSLLGYRVRVQEQ